MYDTLYAILNKSAKTLHYNILYFVRKYWTKSIHLRLITFSSHRRNSTNLSLLMFELCSLLCLIIYSRNFEIAHAQKRLLCLSEFVILVLHYNTRKLFYHLKQAQKSISNLSNLYKKENVSL